MPAVTRTQMKNSKNSVTNVPIVNLMKDVVPIRNCVKLTIAIPSPVIDAKASFVSEMKELLRLCEVTEGKENKMKTAIKIFELNIVELPHLISNYGIDMWILYIATAYNKTTQFLRDRENGDYTQLDKNLVEELFHNLEIYRNMFNHIIKNYNGVKYHPNLNEAKAEILRDASTSSTRPRRNIKRVNYAGMDMGEEDIGEICVFKPWFKDGKVIEKCFKTRLSQANELDDEDYIFEEDKDDEVEEEKEKICEKIWAKIHPEKSIETKRPRRNVEQVCYAGMDMNEEDEGTVNVSKRWFENGKVTYKWSKANSNQIGDSEYIPEDQDEDEAIIYRYGKKIYI